MTKSITQHIICPSQKHEVKPNKAKRFSSNTVQKVKSWGGQQSSKFNTLFFPSHYTTKPEIKRTTTNNKVQDMSQGYF